jgi:predicted  nucleic acid-binding Zn-ribbon protein
MAITFSKPTPQAQEQLPTQDFGSFERRIRTLEESVTNLRKIVQVTEENILIKSRHNSTEFKALTSDLNELRRENRELREKMLMMIKDMGSVARAEDVKVLERYISLWNPVKFVSQNEIENLVEDIISRRARKQPAGDPGTPEEQ